MRVKGILLPNSPHIFLVTKQREKKEEAEDRTTSNSEKNKLESLPVENMYMFKLVESKTKAEMKIKQHSELVSKTPFRLSAEVYLIIHEKVNLLFCQITCR